MSSTMDHAQKYFDLSNNADIESIEHMLDENITYSSDNTGIFYGKKDVMNMKQNFFASFDELIWKIHKVSEITDNIVLFDFTFYGIKNGKEVERSGLEYVVINHKSLIQHIEVRNKI